MYTQGDDLDGENYQLSQFRNENIRVKDAVICIARFASEQNANKFGWNLAMRYQLRYPSLSWPTCVEQINIINYHKRV